MAGKIIKMKRKSHWKKIYKGNAVQFGILIAIAAPIKAANACWKFNFRIARN